jgi:hypothetical protein
MRPFAHPAKESISLEGILHALSDPGRMAIPIGRKGMAAIKRNAHPRRR